MTTIPNDDFDMCCGSRPHVTSTCTKHLPTVDVKAKCRICGDNIHAVNTAKLMIEWNKRQRSKA
jgi:hypothetical protein